VRLPVTFTFSNVCVWPTELKLTNKLSMRAVSKTIFPTERATETSVRDFILNPS
jgi:hypothetical protein